MNEAFQDLRGLTDLANEAVSRRWCVYTRRLRLAGVYLCREDWG